MSVNGSTVRELGTKADTDQDDVRVDGRRVRGAEVKRYILLNKPSGYVSTRSDPQRRPTVIDLLRGVQEYVYPVGRLDYDTEGLLLLTNDGDLAAKLTHPRHGVERTYRASVAGVPDLRHPAYRQALEQEVLSELLRHEGPHSSGTRPPDHIRRPGGARAPE